MDELARLTPATIDVLRVLKAADGRCWGLLVIKQSGRPPGSVYPILERLEKSGWVSSEWEVSTERSGPRRRFYELTIEGSAAARLAIMRFDDKSRVIALRAVRGES